MKNINKYMAYDYKKTIQKVGVALVQILIAGGLAYVTERPEWLFLVPVFEGLRNYFKHKD